MDPAKPMIEWVNVSKVYVSGSRPALERLSLRVGRGELLVLLGSSGSGKTTALKLVNRLEEPTTGRVRVRGRDVSEHDPWALRRSVGYVFQGVGLFPHRTVAENIGLVPELEGWPEERTRARTDELLHLVGLPPARFRDRYPDELSGGQAQRVGVARALATGPEILLMDEPFGALDAVTRARLQDELLALRARIDQTIVFVTHDLVEALRLGDRIAVLHRGRLQQVGPPAELDRAPSTPFVRDLLERLRARTREVENVLGRGAGP